ncbi:DUF6086 family protein [Actinomadura sp. DC4]|uniref:DUF6086 family protein n=1 Tax=Actinomadura sp. DC4 TaxID=3055069 RepID=UPI0025AFEC83|nr:DUF6086 family protein [Actinomadura sp. DC4]MDN3351355.1 DUF6086 family protein [Actinomadura sp. DC4]
MSYIFDIGDETIWSPSLRTGRLYVGLTTCIADLEGRPSGLVANAEDMYALEPGEFRSLVEAVHANFFSTEHQVYRGQLRGWLMTSLVLLQRAHLDLPVANEPDEDLQQDLAVYAKSMPA